MDFLDLVIVALAIMVAVYGYRRGVSWVGPSLCGLLVGIVIGALLAPPLARWIAGPSHDRDQLRAMVATGFFLFCVFSFQGLGTALGFRFRLWALRSRYALWDSIGGATLAILGLLVSSWYVGLSFANSRFTLLDQQIQGSTVVRTLTSLAPNPPTALTQIQRVLADPNNFSGVFAGINGNSLPAASIPANVDTPGIRLATAATDKVLATSSQCGGIEAGSAWPVDPTDVVTNAHVVAGSEKVQVVDTSGHTYDAQVILFDPNVDISVLHIPDAHFKPLTVADADPASGVTGAVIGYPHGGDEQVVGAAVRGTEAARGYNIYQDAIVTRTIEVLASHVVPGNSGGPVVDTTGRVIGLVFAASTTDSSEGYALSVSQIRDDLTAARGLAAPVDTGGCIQ